MDKLAVLGGREVWGASIGVPCSQRLCRERLGYWEVLGEGPERRLHATIAVH